MNGICECGCGGETPISLYSSKPLGYVKGEPRRFIPTHHTRLQKRRDIEERFHSKTSVDPQTGCWIWAGPKDRQGYGHFYAGEKKNNDHRYSVNVLAHRWSYRRFVGEIPEGLLVLHKCDVPSCVNPAHLWVGTQADNVADCAAKGRRGNRWGHRPVSGPVSA